MKLDVRPETTLLTARLGPLPPARALERIADLPRLRAPAKLVLRPDAEAGLLAEVPRALERERAEACVRTALDDAARWLEDPVDPAAAPDPTQAAKVGLAEAAADLSGALGPQPGGALRLDTPVGARLRLDVDANGTTRIACEQRLEVVEPEPLHALARFALEANGRLRLARLAVSWDRSGVATVTWDALLPAGVPLGRTLADAVRAVSAAWAATHRTLRLLAGPKLAREFLQLRSTSVGRAPASTEEKHHDRSSP